MNILEALIIAAVASVLFLLFVVGIVVYHNFSQIFSPENSKKARFKRLLTQESTPLHGSGLRREIRKAFERVLIPLSKADKRAALLGVLAQDPRPSYQHDPDRVYGMAFGGLEVRFTVEEPVLHVREITASKSGGEEHGAL